MPLDNVARYHRIRELRVRGGFLEGLVLPLADSLTCLIGGRGTGKTTVLELLRWALDQMPDPQASSSARGLEKLIHANLAGGTVEVLIETDGGVPYTVRRAANASAPLVLNASGDPVDVDLKHGSLFTVEVYSQHQIEDIAVDPLFQLKLLDKFVASEVRSINSQIDACLRELNANSGEIVKARGSVPDLRDRVALLPEIAEKLKSYAPVEGDSTDASLRSAGEVRALRDREARAIPRLIKALEDARLQILQTEGGISRSVDGIVDDPILAGPNRAQFEEVSRAVGAGVQKITRHLGDAAQAAQETSTVLKSAEATLRGVHLQQEKAYLTLLESQAKERDRATERDGLLRQRSELEEHQRTLVSAQAQLIERLEARSALLRRLSELRDERFRLRTSVADRLTAQLSPAIHVEIEQYGNSDAYRDLLMEAMKGAGFKYAALVERVVQRLPPHELTGLVERGEAALLADHLEVEVDRANRFLLQLREKPVMFEVDTVELHDRPTITLLDGADYKDSSALSTGQKCTTILPILLLESASPLLIDQPEDNLDNAFIYETVVKSVRRVHGTRQLMFVTHNPNIPVLGDAQVVHVMRSDGRVGSVKASGSVDDVKSEIEMVLEGGREAFTRRKERYGY